MEKGKLTGWIVSDNMEYASTERRILVLDFLKEAEKLEIELIYKDRLCLSKELAAIFAGEIAPPDFHVYTHQYVGGILEACGAKGFNSALATITCNNKNLATIALRKHGIPQPKTLLLPMLRKRQTEEDIKNLIRDLADTMGFPLIVKEEEGSLGEQVFLINDFDELTSVIMDFWKHKKSGLVQEFIKDSFGRDLRMHVVGDEVIGAIERRSLKEGEFRANIHLGGVGTTHIPTDEERSIAIAAARACGCTHAGVDLLLSEDGPLVCEVNSQAQFFTKEECDVNTANLILTEILRNMS